MLGPPLGSTSLFLTASLRCRISRAPGCCSYFALFPGQIIFSVCCTQRLLGRSLCNTTVPSRGVWNSCSTQPLRHLAVAETMLEGLNSDDPRHSHIHGAVVARSRLQDMGFRPPEWHALANGERPHGFPDPDDVGPRCSGWQRVATQDANGFFLTTAVWQRLSGKSRALLRSQGGPLAGLPFSCCPSSFHTRFAPQVFRVLFLRRLWFPLPLTKRICGCGRLLDSFGHHRAACANVGVLGRRGFALESAAARVCREAGGRVSVNQCPRLGHCHPRRSRQPPIGGGCRWPLPVPRRTVGHRHYDGFPSQLHRGTSREVC